MFTIIAFAIIFGVAGLCFVGMCCAIGQQISNDRARREYRQWQQRAGSYHRGPAYHRSGQQFHNAHRQYVKQQVYNNCRQQCGCQCKAMWECQIFQDAANNPFNDWVM